MNDLKVGVRDLKTRLSEYLHLVKSGRTVLVTEHGKAIGRIVPVETTLDQRVSVLKQAGLIFWNGKKLPLSQPVVKNTGRKQISEILVEMRE